MLESHELELLETAREIIRKRYKADWHVVGCALRTRSGRIHTGVHLECYVGRVTVCAEAVAIGRAVTDGDDVIESIVSVRQASANDLTPAVVSPCGMCREMLNDYAPEAVVIVPLDDGPGTVSVASLLPGRYRRE